MRSVLLLASSVLLHSAVFPPISVSQVVWVALVPLLLALAGKSLATGAALGLVWGTAAIWGVGYWVPEALNHYYEQPLWFGYAFALAASVIFAGSYYAIFGALAVYLGKMTRGLPRVLCLSCAWVSVEYLRANLLTGDPWLLYGYALVPYGTLAQVADIGGVYGLSFLAFLPNAVLAEIIQGEESLLKRLSALRFGAALLLASFVYGSIELDRDRNQGAGIDVALVQGNNDLGAEWRSELYGEGFRRYLALTQRALRKTRATLIVWPESSITFHLDQEDHYRKQLASVLAPSGASLVLGGPHLEESRTGEQRYFNSAFLLSPEGEVGSRYDKQHLLPFGEYFPLRTIELLRRRFERARYFTASDELHRLKTEFGPLATLICFEGLFPELAREQMSNGAGLLLNLSNDAWLGRGPGAEQHLLMVSLRAIENRTWVLRATTTGISAVIDPVGKTVSSLGEGEMGILAAHVTLSRGGTLYQAWGDGFVGVCFLSVACVPLGRAIRARRIELAGDATPVSSTS